jgi:hypothetical protein
MKLIYYFDYGRTREDDEPVFAHIKSRHIPSVGDTISWGLKDGELYWKVNQKTFSYRNGKLTQITIYLIES